MRCDRAAELVSAYVDRELRGDDHASVAAHIEACDVCRELVDETTRASEAVRALGREPSPAALASRIYANLANSAGEHDARKGVLPWRVPSNVWRNAAALAACCVLSVLVTWWVVSATGQVDQMEQQIVTAHVRSLIQDSPIQVASSDSHTVKPWFAGRVDFAPEVRDLTADGFPLLGGRLDYVNGRRVGALVYRRRLHTVNVFMWRAQGNEDIAPTAATKNGFNLLTWTRGGVTYWAVSDVDATELKHLQILL